MVGPEICIAAKLAWESQQCHTQCQMTPPGERSYSC